MVMIVDKIEFKCHNCNSDMSKVLNNISYDVGEDNFFHSIYIDDENGKETDETITIPLEHDMVLHCGKCETDFDMYDIINYRLKLERDKNLNNIL